MMYQQEMNNGKACNDERKYPEPWPNLHIAVKQYQSCTVCYERHYCVQDSRGLNGRTSLQEVKTKTDF